MVDFLALIYDSSRKTFKRSLPSITVIKNYTFKHLSRRYIKMRPISQIRQAKLKRRLTAKCGVEWPTWVKSVQMLSLCCPTKESKLWSCTSIIMCFRWKLSCHKLFVFLWNIMTLPGWLSITNPHRVVTYISMSVFFVFIFCQ